VPRRAVAATLLAAAATGCSLVTSFDGFTGSDASGPGDGATQVDGESGDAIGGDVGSAGDTASTGDAPVDATASDGATLDSPADGGGTDAPTGPITFVQVAAAAPSGSVATASVTFAKAQGAGDLIALAIGWGAATTSITITGVSDSAGNGYTNAVGPTRISAGIAQSIYYAKAVAPAAAGANAIKVTFAAATTPVELCAVEYAGLDPSAPFDTAAAFGGRSTSANSGPVTTTTGRELVFGAGITQGSFTGPGSTFTLRNLAGGGAGVVEDLTVSSTGTYSANAPIASSSYYVMQVATFR